MRSFGSGHAMPGRRHFIERFARAHPENHAPREHGAERGERLRDDRGVVAKGRA